MDKSVELLYAKKFARQVKEEICYVPLDYDKEMRKLSTSEYKPLSPSEKRIGSFIDKRIYHIPDGNSFKIGIERFRCPELLFEPAIDGMSNEGIHKMIVDSILKCDKDIQKELFFNIVLSGGSSMFEGLPARLKKEITSLVPPNMKINIRASQERNNAAWIGASIFASLGEFPKIAISEDEYEQCGPNIYRYLF